MARKAKTSTQPAPARQLLAAAHVTLDWPSVACGLMDTISMDAGEAEEQEEGEDEEEEEEEEAVERANGRRLYDEQPGESYPMSEKQLFKKRQMVRVKNGVAVQANTIRLTSATFRFIGLTVGTRASCALYALVSTRSRSRGSLETTCVCPNRHSQDLSSRRLKDNAGGCVQYVAGPPYKRVPLSGDPGAER